MTNRLKVSLMRHPQSMDNYEGILQGQRNTPPIRYKRELYSTTLDGLLEDNPIDVIFSSDLQRALLPAREIYDELNSAYSENRPNHRLIHIVDPLLRERARGPLEGLHSDKVMEILRGKDVIYLDGQSFDQVTEFLIQRAREDGLFSDRVPHNYPTVNHYLVFLNDPRYGETFPDMERRVNDFRQFHLERYETAGGSILIVGHSHYLYHLRNDLVDGDIVSRPYREMGNQAVTRLIKNDSLSPYRELNGRCLQTTQENAMGANIS